jgi:hypothetical protein
VFGLLAVIGTIAILAVPAALHAQFDTAAVLGTITDSSGAVVSGANVTLTNVDTGVSAKFACGNSGTYEFLNVHIGRYELEAVAKGFAKSVSDTFQVTVDARQRVDLELKVGSISETVTVSGAATQLETDSSGRGQVVGQQQIVDLPLNGRSYADLTLLADGARKGLRDDREASYNVNGQRFENNNFQLDGVDNNAYATSNVVNSNQILQPPPDAVEEFRVQTNNYSAEYGNAAGAVINASFRSGTNRLHTTLWEFDRNTVFNATGFFKPVDDLKPVLQKNQFGATVGGPIIQDKTFFFADYEGNRSTTQTIMYSTIPTMDQRNGILGTSIMNPLTNGLYSNGVIPASAISPFATKVLSQLPAPNISIGGYNYQSTPAFIDHTDKFDLKLDHHFSDKLNGFVRLSQRKSNETGYTPIPGPIYGGGLASGASVDGFLHTMSQGLAASLSFVISPTMMIDVHAGVTRTKAGEDPFGLGGPGMQELYGIPGLPEGYPVGGGLTAQSISGFTAMGRDSGLPLVQDPMVRDFPKIDFSKIMGRLTTKIGFEYLSYSTRVNDNTNDYGADSYSGQFSKPTGGKAIAGTYDLADFLVGARSSYAISNMFFPIMQQWMAFGYVQNDFKASSKLTLNLGLRYEFATPQMEKNNHLSNFDPVTDSIVYATSGSIYDRSTIHPDYDNFAPRVGFAYTPAPKWVVRSGFAVSYVNFNRLGAEDLLPENYPETLSLSISQQPSQGLCQGSSDYNNCFRTTQQGYPLDALVAGNINQVNARFRYIPADTRTAYVMSWHFSIQHQLPGNMMLDVGYVGNKGIGLLLLADYNQAVPNPPLPAAAIPLNSRRPIQNFGNIQIAYNRDNSTYEGLQTKLERRFRGGLSLLNNFTWSKAIELSPGQLEDVSVGTVVANQNTRINYQNPWSEKGLATEDVPFLDVLSAIWEVPVGRGRKFASTMSNPLNLILGGWRMAGINSMYSGNPINFIYSPASDYTVSSDSKDYRPDLVGNPFLPSNQRTWLQYWNPAALIIPPSRTQPFGNLGDNVGRSPGLYNLDLSLQKEVSVGERIRVQFRADAFNLQNRTNFQNANSVVGNAAFGQTQSTYPARQLQFALKLFY